MTATTYGSLPGVEITVRGVAITGIVVGREQKLVAFGNGDTNNGTASANSPEKVLSKTEARDKFGSDTELAQGLEQSIQNGANAQEGFLYGVAPSEVSVTAESASQSGTLANAPIVEDTGEITFTDTTDGDLTVEFRYESSLSTPSDADTVFINPHTGDYQADASAAGSYEVDYTHLEWSKAFDSADGVLNEKESGIYVALSDTESVASDLSSKVNNLRDPDFKLVRGIAGAQPNATADGSEDSLADGDAKIDVNNYSNNIDNDSMFLIGGARRENASDTLLGAVAGLFAGNELINPVYKDQLKGVAPDQRLIKADRDSLRDNHQVIAISKEGSTNLHANTSTSTESDWQRDFHRRRIVDQVILIAKEVGDGIEGDLNSDDVRAAAEGAISGEIENLISDGVLEGNTSDTTNWFVNITEPSSDEAAVNLGIKPQGIIKNVDVIIDVEA